MLRLRYTWFTCHTATPCCGDLVDRQYFGVWHQCATQLETRLLKYCTPSVNAFIQVEHLPRKAKGEKKCLLEGGLAGSNNLQLQTMMHWMFYQVNICPFSHACELSLVQTCLTWESQKNMNKRIMTLWMKKRKKKRKSIWHPVRRKERQ